MHNWKTDRKDFFYFRTATQDQHVDEEEYTGTATLDEAEVAEDDILYGQPTMFEGEVSNYLCFVHQSVEQLAILKR